MKIAFHFFIITIPTIVAFSSPRRLVPSSSSCCATLNETTETNPQLHLFNSLTLKKDPFQPINPQKVSMYTCGPTVYDYAHVGNFRAFLTYDVLKRTLQYFGYQVDHVCNLTDVDDKIIKKVSPRMI